MVISIDLILGTPSEDDMRLSLVAVLIVAALISVLSMRCYIGQRNHENGIENILMLINGKDAPVKSLEFYNAFYNFTTKDSMIIDAFNQEVLVNSKDGIKSALNNKFMYMKIHFNDGSHALCQLRLSESSAYWLISIEINSNDIDMHYAFNDCQRNSVISKTLFCLLE